MYTILVVDDEKDIVSALEIYLKAEGYRVLTEQYGMTQDECCPPATGKRPWPRRRGRTCTSF